MTRLLTSIAGGLLGLGAMLLGDSGNIVTGETHLKLGEVVGVVTTFVVCTAWVVTRFVKLQDAMAEHAAAIDRMSKQMESLYCVRHPDTQCPKEKTEVIR